MARKRHVKPTIDTLTGIERAPSSDACGELVCPVIFLWREPGAVFQPKNLTGALPHGTPVQVGEKHTLNGFDWYKVTGKDAGSGAQAGWLRSSLLLETGVNG